MRRSMRMRLKKDQQFAKEYLASKQKMKSYDQTLRKDAGLHAAIPSIEKYQYMMRTLINESDATMTHVKEGKIKEYALSVKEVRTVSSYIQEQTMTLLDDELSEYQVLYQSLQKDTKPMRSSPYVCLRCPLGSHYGWRI
ncbi:hypothetical protein ACEQPO_26695 [Bacillus sp. SL00103]